jgi:4-amino-4-deoxy-L-arabinose transferase-like glycosyltransferase
LNHQDTKNEPIASSQQPAANGTHHSSLITHHSSLSSVLSPQSLVLIIFTLLALFYARALPLFEATDEGAHFLYVHHLLETGQLPLLEGRLATTGDAPPVERWSFERHQPPLYYAIGALLVSWSQREDIDTYLQPNLLIFLRGIVEDNPNMWLHSPSSSGDTAAAVWTLRLYSLALALGTLLAIYHTAQLAFGRQDIALLAMTFVVALPMFISLSASINNDNLIIFIFSVAIYWCLRIWQRRDITRVDIVVVSLLLSAAALTKVTGVTLFGIVYLSLFIGAYRGSYSWRKVGLLIGISLVAAAILAGWWYLRNLTLYGDMLASDATITFFSENPQRRSVDAIVGEIPRVWRTFWFGIGYLHALVYAPDWYYLYTGVITALGIAGLGIYGLKTASHTTKSFLPLSMLERGPGGEVSSHTDSSPPPRVRGGGRGEGFTIFFFLATLAALTIALFAGTRQIDISYGRILYPALAGLAPLLVLGWLALLGRRWTLLALLPLFAVAVITPFVYLPAAYPTLETVEALPGNAVPLDSHAEGLSLLGYEPLVKQVFPGDTIHLTLYLRGQHPDNPALSVKLIDPNQTTVRAATEIYPGMSPTSALAPDSRYRIQVPLTLDSPPADQSDFNPRQLRIAVAWLNPVTAETLTWDNPPVLDDGPILVFPNRPPIQLDVQTDVVYGDLIRLAGHSALPAEVQPGDTIPVSLHWQQVNHTDTDWTVAIGLLDAQNNVLTSADDRPPGYPTSIWLPKVDFLDARQLVIPADAAPGDYRLYVGWYRLADGERLAPRGSNVEGTLYLAPYIISVVGAD